MAKLTLTEAQRTLLGIITSVEAGVTTPEDAVEELATLKSEAKEAGLTFRADYSLEEFQNIAAVADKYDESVEPSYEESVEPSY